MDHPIGLHLPSKVFCALVDHVGELFYGPQAEAALCGIIQHWIATTPAASRPWLDNGGPDDSDADARNDSNPRACAETDAASCATSTSPPSGTVLQAAPPPAFPPPTVQAVPVLAARADSTAASRGYQWKQVFLPNGTELRVIHGGRSTYATVQDEQIISDGAPTTPSRLANMRGCGTRNAWRITWLRFPGHTRWQRAAECRR